MSVVHAGGHVYEVREVHGEAPSVPGDGAGEIVTITILRDGDEVTSLDFETTGRNGMGSVTRDATIDVQAHRRGARIEVLVREAWAIWCEPCDQQHLHELVSTVITCGADGCSDAQSVTIGLPPVPQRSTVGACAARGSRSCSLSPRARAAPRRPRRSHRPRPSRTRPRAARTT